MSVLAAKDRLMQAQSCMETRRYDEVEAVLDAAVGFLVGLPDAETAPVVAEIIVLRAAAVEAVVAEQTGVKVRAARRQLARAKSNIEAGIIVPSGFEDAICGVVPFLEGLTDADKAPLLAEMTLLRARLRGDAPAPASSPATPWSAAYFETGMGSPRR